MLVDSHCHLDYLERDGRLDDAIARARTAGVGLMLTIGTRLDAFDKVRAIAERHDDVYCTVGVHPHEAENEAEVEIDRLLDAARHPKVVGIGETGLDYYYDKSPRDIQRRLFRIHIRAARASGLPVIVHTREADDDTVAILAEEMAEGAFRGLIHCFSTSRELAENSVEMGLYVSMSGILTFDNTDTIRATARDLPLDRLLVETDSPYLAPVPRRGKRNEPAFVVHTAAKLAEIRGITAEELAQATTENFFTLFSKIPRATV